MAIKLQIPRVQKLRFPERANAKGAGVQRFLTID